MERTLIIVKPDGVSRGLVGEIIRRYERKGLKITYMSMTKADIATAEKHYEMHKGKPFYNELIKFMTSGPILIVVIEGTNVIEIVRKINGATKIEDANPGSIRGDFATSTAQNIVHSSDSIESAEKEIALWIK